jgi:hypothetical protein
MAELSHTVSREVLLTREGLFDVVVAEDVLPKVLHRWGPIPGVQATRDLTGPWNTPGSERTVVLGDGNTARERVLIWERPRKFEYRVSEITGPFGRLVDHAVGSWVFTETFHGSSFEWTYTFIARGRAAEIVLAPVVHTAWARYMEQCAGLTARLADSPAGAYSPDGPVG